MPEPIVTVVITPREGHFIWDQSLKSVLDDNSLPFRLIYVDLASPPKIENAIRAEAAARGFEVLRHDEWVAPAVARKRALAHVTTKYVACIDNDILVKPGCLEKLVTCAEETGAGLVCPLYVQVGGGREPTIHMAGGVFEWSNEKRPRLLREGHRLAGAPLTQTAGLVREKVDFPEFHYVLGRMDLLRRPGAISDDVLLLHEHLDVALFARSQGMDVMFEPSARARYVAFNSRPLEDLEFYRKRWDIEACRKSLVAFAKKWQPPEGSEVIESMKSYAAGRLRAVELCREGPASADLAQAMEPGELAQSRCALREQAFARGYAEADVRSIDKACDAATLLFDGLYRADGRPFLSHAIGTASALVRYELSPQIVRAGLLHAAIMHRPKWISDAALEGAIKGADRIDRLIRAQDNIAKFLEREAVDLSQVSIEGASVMCLLAANETDMVLSGEFRATGRPARFSAMASARIKDVLSCFGIEGLAALLHPPEATARSWPLFGAKAPGYSFRLDDKQKLLSQILNSGVQVKAIDNA